MGRFDLTEHEWSIIDKAQQRIMFINYRLDLNFISHRKPTSGISNSTDRHQYSAFDKSYEIEAYGNA